jgi:hypothetical protein
MNNLLPYCGLVDARISASEKDLPVKQASMPMYETLDFVNFNWGRILNSYNATQTHSIFVKI